MKIKGYIIAAAVAVAVFALVGCSNSGESLRVMSYNVRNGRGMDDVTDLQRVADAINAEAPEVVAIQELDSVTTRSNGVDVLEVLAGMTGMHPTYAATIEYCGGKYGIGILSKDEPLGVHSVALPGRNEARRLLLVEFEKYVMACTHLSLNGEDRMLSLPIIREEISKESKPVIIAGDWNTCPDTPFIEEIQHDFKILSNTEILTFPADAPEKTLDYIAGYIGGGHSYNVISTWVPEESVASDHLPVVADLTLK